MLSRRLQQGGEGDDDGDEDEEDDGDDDEDEDDEVVADDPREIQENFVRVGSSKKGLDKASSKGETSPGHMVLWQLCLEWVSRFRDGCFRL